MCTTGTRGLRGWRTRETPVAKNGLPAISAGVGGRMPSRASSSRSFAVGVGVDVDVAVDVAVPVAAALAPPVLAPGPAACQVPEPGADPGPQGPEELLGLGAEGGHC